MDVGKRIKARRKQIGMNAESLAEMLKCAPSTVYRYESGDIMKMPISVIPMIADALHTTPGYLMGWTDIESDTPKLSKDEIMLLEAWRKAEHTAKQYALEMLTTHPAKKANRA